MEYMVPLFWGVFFDIIFKDAIAILKSILYFFPKKEKKPLIEFGVVFNLVLLTYQQSNAKIR